ncbi:hypothetical protein HD553DRAFT_365915 [Filobasidium floriforme]|uniref:uncharacterized protein n=1 Tax=Filobasidium floriforme TaxID=5210 RepID=UPI001E8CF468|nr:uncharacterized protein HD553DRAFT_365915 [Filobasidium floriforme]KAH8077669.1 hypothetical protein HD553DRAFT_365915 [Filobasidium floriforme]
MIGQMGRSDLSLFLRLFFASCPLLSISQCLDRTSLHASTSERPASASFPIAYPSDQFKSSGGLYFPGPCPVKIRPRQSQPYEEAVPRPLGLGAAGAGEGRGSGIEDNSDGGGDRGSGRGDQNDDVTKETWNGDEDRPAGHDKEEEDDEEGPTACDETEYHGHAGRSGGNAAHHLNDWP